MQNFLTILGLTGAIIQIFMYWCLQSGKVDGETASFYAINGLGSLMVATSLTVIYQPTNLGGILMESAWFLISLAGLSKALKKRLA